MRNVAGARDPHERHVTFVVTSPLSPASRRAGAKQVFGGALHITSLPAFADEPSTSLPGQVAEPDAFPERVLEDPPVDRDPFGTAAIVAETAAALRAASDGIRRELVEKEAALAAGTWDHTSPWDLMPMRVKNGKLHGVNIRVSNQVENFEFSEPGIVQEAQVALQFLTGLPFGQPGVAAPPAKPSKAGRSAPTLRPPTHHYDGLSVVHLPGGSKIGFPDGSLAYLATHLKAHAIPTEATSMFVPRTGLQVHVFNAARNIDQVCTLSFCLRTVQPQKKLVASRGTAGAGGAGAGFQSDPLAVYQNGLQEELQGSRLLFMLNGDAVFGLFGAFSVAFVEVDPTHLRLLGSHLKLAIQAMKLQEAQVKAAAEAPPTALVRALTTGVLNRANLAMKRLAGGLRGFHHAQTRPLRFRGSWADIVKDVSRAEVVRAMNFVMFRKDGSALDVVSVDPGRAAAPGGVTAADGFFFLNPRFILCIEDKNHETLLSLLPVNKFDAEGASLLLSSASAERAVDCCTDPASLCDAANALMETRLMPPVHSAAFALMNIEKSAAATTTTQKEMLPLYFEHVKQLAALTQFGVLNNCFPVGYGSHVTKQPWGIAEMAITTPGFSSLLRLPGLFPRYLSQRCIEYMINHNWFSIEWYMAGLSESGRDPEGGHDTFYLKELLEAVDCAARWTNELDFACEWGTRTRHWAYQAGAPKSYIMLREISACEEDNQEMARKTQAKLVAHATQNASVSPRDREPVWWEFALGAQRRLEAIENTGLFVFPVAAFEADGVETAQEELRTPKQADSVREATGTGSAAGIPKPGDRKLLRS